MENTVYNFTSEKIYKKTSWERNLCLGAAGLFALTAGLTYLGVNAGLGPVSIFPIAIGIFTLATAAGVWLLHIGEKRQLKKSLKDLSVDDVLYEINHNCIPLQDVLRRVTASFIILKYNTVSMYLNPCTFSRFSTGNKIHQPQCILFSDQNAPISTTIRYMKQITGQSLRAL